MIKIAKKGVMKTTRKDDARVIGDIDAVITAHFTEGQTSYGLLKLAIAHIKNMRADIENRKGT